MLPLFQEEVQSLKAENIGHKEERQRRDRGRDHGREGGCSWRRGRGQGAVMKTCLRSQSRTASYDDVKLVNR